MQDALKQIEEMAHSKARSKTLDGAMEQLSDAKRQINSEQLDGQGKSEGTQAGFDRQRRRIGRRHRAAVRARNADGLRSHRQEQRHAL